MRTLQGILQASKNGQVIVDTAISLGFKSLRLYKSLSKNTLCIIVDFDDQQQPGSDIDERAFLLKSKIARLLDCKTLILHHPFIATQDKYDILQNSITLPIQDISLLNSIFGKPEQFEINQIDEDKAYKMNLEIYESIFNSNPNNDAPNKNPFHSLNASFTSYTAYAYPSSGKQTEQSIENNPGLSSPSTIPSSQNHKK